MDRVPKASPVGTLTLMASGHATPKDESASAYGVQRLAAAWEAGVSRLERGAGATVTFPFNPASGRCSRVSRFIQIPWTIIQETGITPSIQIDVFDEVKA
jgi:hypothetical protein